jgi:HAD superfamily hydrolase (TIGR01509 family)
VNHPSLLLFDLGGVLIESAVFERLNDCLPKPLDRTAIKERWLLSPSVRRFESGEMEPMEFAEHFIAEWGLGLTPHAFLNEFKSWPRAFFPGARELLRELRITYRVGCLSNSNPLHGEKFKDIEEDFDMVLMSHLLGAVKPDPEIFMLALHQCEVEPCKVYFFDDSYDNRCRRCWRAPMPAFRYCFWKKTAKCGRDGWAMPAKGKGLLSVWRI